MSEQVELEIVVAQQAGFAVATGARLEKATAAFEALGESLSTSLFPLQERLAASSNAPDELEMSLALAFKGGASWVVLSASAEATISVKASWKRKP
jgi:inner membrane protein involved in colicin E2 resistance